MNTLKNYIKQVRGISYKPEEISEIEREDFVPILKANNITENGLDESDLIYIHRSKVSQEQFIRKGDLLVAASSGSKEIVGKHIFFDKDYNGSFGAFCKVVRPNENIYPEFVSTFFKTPTFRRHIRKLIQGANINNLRNEHLDTLIIPNVELVDQIKIASVLNKTESLKKQRKESISMLDDLLESNFLKMFGDPVNNEKGWGTIKLANLINLDRGVSYGIVQRGENVDFGVPVIRIRDLEVNTFLIENIVKTKKEISNQYQRTILEGGEILISIRGTLGKIAIAPNHTKGWNISREVAIIPLRESINKIFILHLLKSKPLQSKLESNRKGVAQSGINLEDLRQYEIIQPPLTMQNEFSGLVEKIEVLKEQFKSSLSDLEQFYASLSQKAFRGELDLSELQINHIVPFSKGGSNEISNLEAISKKENQRIGDKPSKKEDARKVDPFAVDEETAKKQGTDFFNKWQNKHSSKAKSKVTWDKVSSQQVAEWVKEKYRGYHFSTEMLIRFLMDEYVVFPDYYSSEELKKYPHLNGADDLKSFIFSALSDDKFFIHLEQHFYNAEKETFTLKVTDEDYALIESREAKERSGIYFSIIDK